MQTRGVNTDSQVCPSCPLNETRQSCIRKGFVGETVICQMAWLCEDMSFASKRHHLFPDTDSRPIVKNRGKNSPTPTRYDTVGECYHKEVYVIFGTQQTQWQGNSSRNFWFLDISWWQPCGWHQAWHIARDHSWWRWEAPTSNSHWQIVISSRYILTEEKHHIGQR